MENRIGYRIWIEKESKMYYSDTKDNNFVLNCHGQVVKFGYAGDRCGEALFVIRILKDEEYKLMKSIGVKDKEGKLIYEEDILGDEKGNPIGINGRVYYWEGNYKIDNCGGSHTRLHEEALGWHVPFVILGNEFENKELIKKD